MILAADVKISRPAKAKSPYWIAALIASFLPWVVTAVKLLLAAVGAPFEIIETMISAMLYSVPLSAVAWLVLTVFTFVRGGLRQSGLASLGVLPLSLFYVITIAAFDR